MRRTQTQQFDYSKGVVDSQLDSREDTAMYHSAVAELTNLNITAYGTLEAREGLTKLSVIGRQTKKDMTFGFRGRSERLLQIKLIDGRQELAVFHRDDTPGTGGGITKQWKMTTFDVPVGRDLPCCQIIPEFILTDAVDFYLLNDYQQGDFVLLGQAPPAGRMVETYKDGKFDTKIYLPVLQRERSRQAWAYTEKEFRFEGWDTPTDRVVLRNLFSTYASKGEKATATSIVNVNQAIKAADETFEIDVRVAKGDTLAVHINIPGGIWRRPNFLSADALLTPQKEAFKANPGHDINPENLNEKLKGWVIRWNLFKTYGAVEWTCKVSSPKKVGREYKFILTNPGDSFIEKIIDLPMGILFGDALQDDPIDFKLKFTKPNHASRSPIISRSGTTEHYREDHTFTFIIQVKTTESSKADIASVLPYYKDPTCFAYYQGRLFMSGFPGRPSTMLGSMSAQPFNISKRKSYAQISKQLGIGADSQIQAEWVETGDPYASLQKDSSVSLTLDDDTNIEIRNILGTHKNFFLFTSRGVWVREQNAGIIAPDDFFFHRHSTIECSYAKPVQLDESIIFTDIHGQVHLLEWSERSNAYIAYSLSQVARGKVGRVVRLAASLNEQIPRLYALNDEGKVSVLHIKKVQEIQGWSNYEFPQRVLDIEVVNGRLFLLLENELEEGYEIGLYMVDKNSEEEVKWSLKTLPLRPEYVRKNIKRDMLENTSFRPIRATVAMESADNIKINGLDVPLRKFGHDKFDIQAQFRGIAETQLQGYYHLGDPNANIRLEGLSRAGKLTTKIKKLEVLIGG